MLITFSGLDGAGKSTLIAELKQTLEKNDRKVTIRTMYDDLTLYALFRRIRDSFKTLFRLSSNSSPVQSSYNLIPNYSTPDVSDKKGFFTSSIYRIFRSRFVRRMALIGDVLVINLYRLIEEGIRNRVLITDRYFYDSWVDTLRLEETKCPAIRFFLPWVPQPALAVFVDVPAETAFQRKREYPLDYLHWRREAYLQVFNSLEQSLILDNTSTLQKNIEILCHSTLKGSYSI